MFAKRLVIVMFVLLVLPLLMGAQAIPGVDLGVLEAILLQIINGGGAGWLAFAIWNKLVEWWPSIKEWPADALRVAVVGTCIVLALGAYFLLGWLEVITFPTTSREWVAVLFAIAMTAFTSSQLFHGRQKARIEARAG